MPAWPLAERWADWIICSLFAIGTGLLTIIITGEYAGWRRRKCRWCNYRGSPVKIAEHEALDHPDDWQQWQR